MSKALISHCRPRSELNRMLRAFFLICAFAFGAAGPVSGQEVDFAAGRTLVIDTVQLFNQSKFGIRAARLLEAADTQLAEENKSKVFALAEEEKQLTALRETMNAEKFRDLAEEFDLKVQVTREEQLSKAKSLSTRIETQRTTFLNAAAPILQALMLNVGASVLIERRNVVLNTKLADITAIAIAQIDAVLGDGSEPATSVD